MEDNFFLTLHSNTSLHLNEKNHGGEFIIHFGQMIHLPGQWQVALMELHYPMTIKSMLEHTSFVRAIGKSGTSHIRVPNLFVSEEQMVIKLNKVLRNDLIFTLEDDGHIHAQLTEASIREESIFVFPDVLKLQLGFMHEIVFDEKPKLSSYHADVKRGLPQKLFVYSNIVKPYNVSGNHEQLLRIVPMETGNYSFGCTHSHIVDTPFYFPVARQSFDTIEVYIRGDNNELLSFEYGSSTIVLHLKKVA